jgi:hypothetical protein
MPVFIPDSEISKFLITNRANSIHQRESWMVGLYLFYVAFFLNFDGIQIKDILVKKLQ